MSFAALALATKYRAESAATKLVLLAFADRHNEESGCAYPSIKWLCEFSSLNRKTVITAIGRLEAAGVLTDTGERKGDTRQIKVYRVAIETVPKTEQSQKRNSTEKVVKQSQKRDTDTVRTRSEAKASSHAKHLLPDDWEIPAVAELPPQARACAEQWTADSYATHGEAFIGFWRSSRRKMGDWRLTWGNRIVALHSQVMRDQKFGNAPMKAATAKPVSDADRTALRKCDELRKAYEAGEITFDQYMSRKAEALRGADPPPAANREPTSRGQPIGQLIQRIAGAA